MALHTGQHMLSRALADVASAATVSSRLGETACTIDLDRESVDERRLAEAEDLVNAVVDDDVPVRAFFPVRAELAALPLRRAPKVTSNPCASSSSATSTSAPAAARTALARRRWASCASPASSATRARRA